MIWRRLADWCLQDVDWHETFRVKFVMRGGEKVRAGLTVTGATITCSLRLLADHGWPSGTARRWPPAAGADDHGSDRSGTGQRLGGLTPQLSICTMTA